MNAMHVIAIGGWFLVLGACAQTTAVPAAPPGAAPPPATTPFSAGLTPGVVLAVDKRQGKLTLHHGPLANLDVPAMTMVFDVADPRMLDTAAPGDKVRFSLQRINGTPTVTVLERAGE